MKLPLTIVNRKSPIVNVGGFTMIEIALCLAIIGFALISILLVLPSGMNTQRDTREETIIGQDASMLMEAMRGGTRGMDDLTNYVTAITNYFTDYDQFGTVVDRGYFGYTYNDATYWDNGTLQLTMPSMHLTNGLRIIGILSTPEYLSGNLGGPNVSLPTSPGAWPIGRSPINYTLNTSYASNHIVAYIRSFSGLAAEKPPQDNQIMQEDTFSYRVLCVNAPVPMDTNLFQPVWQNNLAYSAGAQVFYNVDFWQATAKTAAGDIPGTPGNPPKWVQIPNYAVEMLNSQRELRLLFEWPQLPNGNVGGFRQSFRSTIAGQLIRTNYSLYFPPTPPGVADLYFYESQSFTNAP